MRFIQNLSPETCSLLSRLHKESQHHRVRQRAQCILLSFQGLDTAALRQIFSVDRITLYNWFNAWDARHFAGLYDKKGRGRPPKLTEEEQYKAQQYLEQHPRDVKKVVHLVEQETSKRVSSKTLKRLLKKTAMCGSVLKRRRRKALIHTSTNGAKPSYVSCKPAKPSGSVPYGILTWPVFAWFPIFLMHGNKEVLLLKFQHRRIDTDSMS
jgi:transposase